MADILYESNYAYDKWLSSLPPEHHPWVITWRLPPAGANAATYAQCQMPANWAKLSDLCSAMRSYAKSSFTRTIHIANIGLARGAPLQLLAKQGWPTTEVRTSLTGHFEAEMMGAINTQNLNVPQILQDKPTSITSTYNTPGQINEVSKLTVQLWLPLPMDRADIDKIVVTGHSITAVKYVFGSTQIAIPSNGGTTYTGTLFIPSLLFFMHRGLLIEYLHDEDNSEGNPIDVTISGFMTNWPDFDMGEGNCRDNVYYTKVVGGYFVGDGRGTLLTDDQYKAIMQFKG